MTDIRQRKADKVRPTGEVVVVFPDYTAILSFLLSTNDNSPYNNPSETVCSKLAFHWLGICNFSRVICSSASYLSSMRTDQNFLEHVYESTWAIF